LCSRRGRWTRCNGRGRRSDRLRTACSEADSRNSDDPKAESPRCSPHGHVISNFHSRHIGRIRSGLKLGSALGRSRDCSFPFESFDRLHEHTSYRGPRRRRASCKSGFSPLPAR
jgi:hypothetical protein